LGIVKGEADGWDSYTTLAPMHDLPVFANALGQKWSPLLGTSALTRFRHAHHCAGFWGLTSDRLADNQTQPTPELLELRAHLLDWWQLALADALGDSTVAAAAVAQAVVLWRQGVAAEHTALKSRRLTVEDYARIVTRKAGWLGTTAACLLHHAGAASRLASFAYAFRLLLCGLQCGDDAMDSAEDEALWGVDYSRALGCPRQALLLAVPRLLEQSATVATVAGFQRLAGWIENHLHALRLPTLPGDPALSAFSAYLTAERIAASCHDDVASHLDDVSH